jgi:LacI family transcriptional regulator
LKRSVTIIDIAKHAGVSFKTVSRVLNNAPTVAEDLRAKVEAAMRELDYKPNRAARLLRGGKAQALGLIVGSQTRTRNSPDADRRLPSYAADVILGLLQACHSAEYHLVIESVSPTEDPASDARTTLERFLDLVKLDGVVLVPPLCDIPWVLDVLDSRKMPFARINPGLALDRALCLVIDNKSAARDVGDAILAQGHRRLGFIAGPDDHAAQRERKTGLLEAVAQVPDASVEVRQGNFLFTSGLARGRELLELPDRPTAIFAANDEMAAGVLAAAVDCGIQVPNDLSLIGFGGLAISEHTWPRIATVSQPTIEIARIAGAELIAQGGQLSDEWGRLVTVPYELTLRQSVGPVPDSR